ncbi:MAG: acyl-ACP--UDP-N-acetylglucosamine O-acyltransferase [Deltaproteobacteria bacterium]|nr:acyl-ACP--UDP-N-acetylglucosamine O-acyltransferase [Deltaproteobacteria bacterium]
MAIHPAAIVGPGAELAEGVEIGPYSIIGDHVAIGRDTVIGAHVIIEGNTVIGERNRIYPFSSLGSPPQDTGYKGEDTQIIIGNDNIIKEYVTINRATTKEDWVTIIGNNNFIMAYAHIAHDCKLGNNIIMSNVATLGGHVEVGDYVNLSGLVAVHQFVRIGAYAFIGGKAAVPQDIPPFMLATGTERAKLYGPNQKGLARQGFSKDTIERLKVAYRIIWRQGRSLNEGIKKVREDIKSFPELEMLLDFLNNSKRGITR